MAKIEPILLQLKKAIICEAANANTINGAISAMDLKIFSATSLSFLTSFAAIP
ncbi:hypothetical protein D9M71_740130 [compost metagenome]